VKLTYRVVGGGREGDWQALPMNQTAQTTYRATVGSEELERSLDPPSDGDSVALQYYVEAFDGEGYSSQSPKGTVTVAYCDTTGPTISGISESDDPVYWPATYCDPDQVTVRAFVSDPSGVAEVKLTYRVVGGGKAGDWQTLDMTKKTGLWMIYWATTVGSEELKKSLDPPTEGASVALQYYVQAFDGEGNWSRSSTGTVTVVYCLH
jgi:hypothetical protein